MSALADRAKEYRRRAQHLREAAESMKDPDIRDQASELAQEWVVLAEKMEAEILHIFGELPARENQDSVVVASGQPSRK